MQNAAIGVEFVVPRFRVKYVFTLFFCQTFGNLLAGLVGNYYDDPVCLSIEADRQIFSNFFNVIFSLFGPGMESGAADHHVPHGSHHLLLLVSR